MTTWVGRGTRGGGGSPPHPYRLALLLVLLAFLVGPVAYALGEWIDEGGVPTSTFSLLLFAVGVVLAGVGKSAEQLVFEVKHRPRLGGA